MIHLQADTTKFEAGLKDAQAKVDAFATEFRKLPLEWQIAHRIDALDFDADRERRLNAIAGVVRPLVEALQFAKQFLDNHDSGFNAQDDVQDRIDAAIGAE